MKWERVSFIFICFVSGDVGVFWPLIGLMGGVVNSWSGLGPIKVFASSWLL